MFLAEMLDELGFIACEADTLDIRGMLREFRPDLIVVGPLRGGGEVRTLLHALQSQLYGGKVMLFGGRSSTALIRTTNLASRRGWRCCRR
jgi:Flp pilus assembly CpaF family ATPase